MSYIHVKQQVIENHCTQVLLKQSYPETIKLCPLDIYVCQFQTYEHISFKFSHYQLWSFKNVLQLR